MEPGLDLHREGGVATLTLRNPAKRNAMTTEMWRRLPIVLDRLTADGDVRALVLTGSGETFCAGADISSLREGTAPQRLAVAAEEALAAFPRPTLAVVRGHCVGGGCQLAAACDLRFAAEDALFGVTPARLGIPYPAAATARLARLAGPSTAKYLLYSAELINAERALRVGLVDEVLSADALPGRVAEFTATLTARSRLTQAVAKEFVDAASLTAPGGPPGEREAHWAQQAQVSGETAEGVAAFLERRAPAFPWHP
ncbi:enoyl-CoA hydratase/isomerase family protein [Streptomyces alkaliterrae]|uniref:Enoyl-CoA hydratase/isomerase family protein n=1 Tax=Streptomyces alkaliterrae TaxID=2213162 RepID=A0A5P0YS86_9ACTN|nr:enoyl-CoA hydratase/isomerase family protein [Streptomyces alkaliterrae]MBB1255880.1 enoyl-CoA hydratase/isomerase family protein [Streptomyces alkaliterrae]MBB1258388.1 enoyl-CoA hydratase/isomerase family protein [Streptomyces alkaliterrae]MQS03191.1 enoyl-CoA hydratase/isomerase family protein [Streptomyces alkaliterrae]